MPTGCARDAGPVPVIPGRRNRKRTIRYDKDRYRGRYLIENAFCRLKDFRRVATRYEKRAANFLSGVALATSLAFRLGMSLGLGANPKRYASVQKPSAIFPFRQLPAKWYGPLLRPAACLSKGPT